MFRVLGLGLNQSRTVRQPKLPHQGVQLAPRVDPLPDPVPNGEPEEVNEVQAAVHGVEVPLDGVPVPVDELD